MWSGPEAAMIFSVPPDTGVPVELAPPPLAAGLLDVEPPHAASPAAASTAAASEK
jgi:hypothetical protein